jgi:hypothetical protein
MGDEGASRRRDDAKSDAEFLADYEAKHGKAKVVVARRDGECRAEVCEVGDRHIAATSEIVRLYPSQRLVHGVCARTAAVERVRKWERWQAESGGQ